MSTEKYCPLHDYEPPENSGFALCPQCELAALPGSPTPRTDAARWRGILQFKEWKFDAEFTHVVSVEFAQQIERELTQANNCLLVLREHIKRIAPELETLIEISRQENNQVEPRL